MKRKNKSATLYTVQAAIIAALYMAVNYAQEMILPTSSTGAVQVRISEVLCTLALFLPSAIPGLTVGCLLSNIIAVGVLPLDMILGTSATLLAAMCAYALRNVKLGSLPLMAMLMPVVFNAVIIGMEIEWFFIEGPFTLTGFLIQAGLVALGEFISCIVLGIPLYYLLKKTPLVSGKSL